MAICPLERRDPKPSSPLAPSNAPGGKRGSDPLCLGVLTKFNARQRRCLLEFWMQLKFCIEFDAFVWGQVCLFY